jgi:DNA polymerase-3 subunit delta'
MSSMKLEKLQPKRFKEFKQILKSKKMSHAYLFSGDFASFDMALYLAKSRFCENLQDNLPCGVCRECRLIEQEEFSDVKIIRPIGQIIKTETIKTLMRDFSRSGFEGKNQVFIIDGCEKLHPNAANSLLKYIEEPQSSSYMILLTSDDSKVLPTIKSRTQVFQFPKNRLLLVEQAEKSGLLKSQANILSDLAKTPSHLEELIQNKKRLDLIQVVERFIDVLFKDELLAYLEAAWMVRLANDKDEQEFIFQVLTILLAGRFNHEQSLSYLKKTYKAHLMWQSNVSFQNAIEYMVIS